MDSSFELHRQRRALFSASARAYGDGRPGYPPELFDLLVERCGLGPGCRILEIGPGTGQATGGLLDAGGSVVAVELGTELARLVESTFTGRDLQVIVGPFEEVDLPSGRFDLVAAGTSFHWVPAEAGLRRCGQALRPGGFLALWWNYFGDPARPDPFHEALQPLLRRHAPQLLDHTGDGSPGAGAHPYALDAGARVAEIDGTGLFGPVSRQVLSWTGVHSASELRRLFASFSPWMALDPEVGEPLLDDLERLAIDRFGGAVERPYLTPIYWAERL